MLELPETRTLANQLGAFVVGREIVDVAGPTSPHKWAWFSGDPEAYGPALAGKRFTDAQAFGMFVEAVAGEQSLIFGDGVNLRLLAPGKALPPKRQLTVHLDDGSALVGTVQMYGGLWLAPAGQLDSPYYETARELPSPLTEAFDRAYFDSLLAAARPTLSAKALLATEQRIPGLGNGVLQDILFEAKINPRTKVKQLSDADRDRLYSAIKTTLALMTEQGGRDTEKDLLGNPGSYSTVLSAKTVERPCPRCGSGIVRQAYLGGNVYFCLTCQPLL